MQHAALYAHAGGTQAVYHDCCIQVGRSGIERLAVALKHDGIQKTARVVDRRLPGCAAGFDSGVVETALPVAPCSPRVSAPNTRIGFSLSLSISHAYISFIPSPGISGLPCVCESMLIL